jgi:hypothetical protein
MPQALHDALSGAVTLGLEGSFNAAVGASVESVVRDFAKGLVLGRTTRRSPRIAHRGRR